MDIESALELTWVPIICFGVALGYGVMLLMSKNPSVLLSKKHPQIVRDKKKYAESTGKLLIFIALASLLNSVLLLVNLTIALVEILTALAVFGVLWKKASDKYGPIN